MFSTEELQQYQRQLGITNWGKQAQKKLKQSTVFVAGAGGLGSPVLYYLAAAGVGNILICDYDTIDATNLNRQILHSFASIGKKKADSAHVRLSELNPHITVSRIKDKIIGSNVKVLIANSDLVIDCLDNFTTRHVLNKACVDLHIPFLHAGVAGFQGQISFFSPPETACLACVFPQNENKGIVYVAGATAGTLGSLQAIEAIKYLTGIGENLKNKILFADMLNMRFETIKIKKNPKCTVCGKK